MKKIKTKLMIGIGIIFIISYSIMMINISTNQSIVKKSDALLASNYASLKYTFQMLWLLNDINSAISEGLSQDSVAEQTLRIVGILEQLEHPLKLQEENITEPGELQLTNSLMKSFEYFRHFLIAREYPFLWNEYNRLFQEIRENIQEIYQMNAESLEAKNNAIKEHAEHILTLQKNIGIVGLALLCILIVFLPLYLIRPIDRFTMKLTNIYEQRFKEKVELKKGHELEKLEEIIEKIIFKISSSEK